MKIKIAICDDEPQALRQVDTYLRKFESETSLTLDTYFFSDSSELVRSVPRDINILLLDIAMGEMSGIEAARQLRKENTDFFLFFITSNTQFALEGYSVHAYAFLEKPLLYDQLKVHLLDAISKIKKTNAPAIKIKTTNALLVVPCTDIVFFEVYGHVSVVVLQNGNRITSNTPLGEFEKNLRLHSFFRCHKSYLINLRSIYAIRDTDVVMVDGSVVPVSRNRRTAFLLAFHEAIGG